MSTLNYKKLIRYLDSGLDPYGSYSAKAIRFAIGTSLVVFFKKLKELPNE